MGFHIWISYMDASISNEWELDGCNPKSHQVLCWVTNHGYLWQKMAWLGLDSLTSPIILYTFLSFQGKGKSSSQDCTKGNHSFTNHPLLFVLGWQNPTPILQIFPPFLPSLIIQQATSPSKITSVKHFNLVFCSFVGAWTTHCTQMVSLDHIRVYVCWSQLSLLKAYFHQTVVITYSSPIAAFHSRFPSGWLAGVPVMSQLARRSSIDQITKLL